VGRLTGIAAHPTDPNTIYVAAAGGGVWKTTDGGQTWNPKTDCPLPAECLPITQMTLSMGAIAVAKSNGNKIYAGTGEADNSADSNFGRGILISSDGGANWTLSVGPGSRFDRLTTAAIAVDPTNANVAYAAMTNSGINVLCCGGDAGVWKTTDGGTTWTKTTASITSSNPWSAIAIDPTNTLIIYAAVGNSGGGSLNGVYKSTNGGTSWALLGNGPVGTSISGLGVGRISLALAPSNAQVLYVAAADVATLGLSKLCDPTMGAAPSPI